MNEARTTLAPSLPKGHVIRTMILEHDILLDNLDLLRELSTELGQMNEPSTELTSRLSVLARGFLDAEPHHQREETVLFPALEARGMAGPPGVMRQEHVVLRRRKAELNDLAGDENPGRQDWTQDLDRVASSLFMDLTDHIMKENHMLYPMALNLIASDGDWEKLKEACDAVGYCTFTPELD